MSDGFETLTRQISRTTSRRQLLKLLAASAGAIAFRNVVKPFRSSAIPTCSGPTNLGPSPCAAGTTPCGPCCCKAGIACLDRVNGVCGCPAGLTPCGTACCAAGTACKSPSTSTCNSTPVTCANGAAVCGTTCCPPGQCCNNGTCGACSICTTGSDACSAPTACPGHPDCICVPRADGSGNFCGSAQGLGPSCTTNADCPNVGDVCATTSCGNFCAHTCPSGGA